MKACSRCGVVSDDFSPDKRAKDGLQPACRPCNRVAQKAARDADPDAARLKERAYYATNRSRVLANNAASRARHRDSVLEAKRAYYRKRRGTSEYQEKSRKYRELTKGAKRAYDREYRKRHPDVTVERAKEWRRKNPEKRRAIVTSYSAKRRAKEDRGVPSATLAEWTTAQPKVCFYCGAECATNFHVDHFMPLSKGGQHVLTNLRIACPGCNLHKSAKLPLEWINEISANDPLYVEAA